MLPVTNRSKPKIKTIKIGSKNHSYKTYSWGAHEAIFGPLKGTTFNSKAELKAAMEAHPNYNNKLNEAKDSMIETKPAGGGTHDVYWNGKKTHHQLIHVSGGGSRGAARAAVGGYRYFIHNTKTGKSVNFSFSLPDAKRELRRRYNANDPHSMNEDAPVNNVGGGNVAGLGVGPQGEPPGRLAIMKKKPIKRFKDFLKKTKK